MHVANFLLEFIIVKYKTNEIDYMKNLILDLKNHATYFLVYYVFFYIWVWNYYPYQYFYFWGILK